MTTDEVKRAFGEYLSIKARVRSAAEILAELRVDMSNASAGGIPNSAADSFLPRIDKYSRIVEDGNARMSRIERLLYLIDDTVGQTIVEQRFIKGVPFEQMSTEIPELSYSSRRSIFYHYRTALKQIVEKTSLPEEN